MKLQISECCKCLHLCVTFENKQFDWWHLSMLSVASQQIVLKMNTTGCISEASWFNCFWYHVFLAFCLKSNVFFFLFLFMYVDQWSYWIGATQQVSEILKMMKLLNQNICLDLQTLYHLSISVSIEQCNFLSLLIPTFLFLHIPSSSFLSCLTFLLPLSFPLFLSSFVLSSLSYIF